MSKVMLARKNIETCYFDFSKKNAAKKIGGYESVAATNVIFSSWKCQPLFFIAHTHSHAKGVKPNLAVRILPEFSSPWADG